MVRPLCRPFEGVKGVWMRLVSFSLGFILDGGSHPKVLRSYSRLCARKSSWQAPETLWVAGIRTTGLSWVVRMPGKRLTAVLLLQPVYMLSFYSSSDAYSMICLLVSLAVENLPS